MEEKKNQEVVSELFVLHSESSKNFNCQDCDCPDPGTGSDNCTCEDS